MQAHLEDYLYKQISQTRPDDPRLTIWPRTVIQQMLDDNLIANPKQAWRTLEKWLRKGWYNYGVALDLGWVTGLKETKIRDIPT